MLLSGFVGWLLLLFWLLVVGFSVAAAAVVANFLKKTVGSFWSVFLKLLAYI